MTDHNASSLSHSDVPTRSLARSSIPRSSSSYGSYDTGESSTAASPLHDMPIDKAAFGRSSPHRLQEPSSDARFAEHGDHNPSHDAHQRRRSHKSRPSGGFLLSNSILNDNPKPGPKHRSDGRRRSRIPVESRKGKSPLRFSEDSNPSVSVDPHTSVDGPERAKTRAARMSTGGFDVHDDRPRSELANRRRSMLPSLRPSSAPLDVDSTQIVSMALSLSESRREAPNRNISNPIPPRLAQLPDSTTGRSLKQHLQQQRRSSRGISPRADSHLSPRIVSAPRISSPLQSTFDHDGTYTYHFSSSTLHRAQRAKEYLELMAQYRRLLIFLPPLKQEARSRPSTSSPLTSPNSIGSPLDHPRSRALGRAYNPLQYIRNRKIRTRERKAIDGEAQGFGDVPRVTDWIDEVAASTAASLISDSPKLPPFPAVDENISQQPPASNLPRPVSALNKPKRLKFEWSIDPADMLADIYWLEQGNNRFLIENRHYAKIYTPQAEVSQPTTQATDPSKSTLTTPVAKEKSDGDDHDMSEQDAAHSIKTDVETTVTSTRDRARQKLQDLRGIHHKNSSSIHSHHDFLRFRRGSSSDSSDDESDRRRRARNGTISASGKDLLEKQMNEMLAKESQDEQNHSTAEADVSYLKPLPAGLVTPEQTPQVPRRGHSHKPSRTEAMEHLDKALPGKVGQTPPVYSGRASLEVPNLPYRSSMDLDPSKGHRNGYVPAIGMDLSPSNSRPSSPARNPFSKVKSMFRDRSRDREDRENDERIEKIASPINPTGTTNSPTPTEHATQPLERPRSKSSTREFITKTTHESYKSHRAIGSLSLRPDEQVGLRTIFKGGAKLDDMIRGGVSKMTDLIWKKDSDSDSGDEESETDVRRGRPRGSALLSPKSAARNYDGRRPVKNQGDNMPQFKSRPSSMDKSALHELVSSSAQVLSRPPSRSPRFEQLKPPRIDIRKASPDLSELEESNPHSLVESDMSEIDARSQDPRRPINRPRQTSKELQNLLALSGNESSMSHMGHRVHISEHRNWIIPDRTSLSHNALISRREVARLRTLILCSGIKAMELSRRANEPHLLSRQSNKDEDLAWTEIGRFMPDGEPNLRVPQTELYPTAARILSRSVDRSIKVFERSATGFSTETAPRLQQRADTIHNRIGLEFMDMTRRAADEADEVSHDIVDYQRLKAKSVVDTIDKMLRRRRRRFRWVRRAGWLALEWVLVGFMWYVWFVVMLARIILGVGRGAVSVIRWVLFL
ncbi:hypothetical protein GGS24DRAFT_446510 [Hypoxylon argillaceum]|nr:hypothetical protein GGS24DRAFT_446510 [Hypoxylon argillaceum]